MSWAIYSAKYFSTLNIQIYLWHKKKQLNTKPRVCSCWYVSLNHSTEKHCIFFRTGVNQCESVSHFVNSSCFRQDDIRGFRAQGYTFEMLSLLRLAVCEGNLFMSCMSVALYLLAKWLAEFTTVSLMSTEIIDTVTFLMTRIGQH